MTVWQAIISGIVQGVTEFVPISRSAHLVLTEKVFGVDESEVVFLLHFKICI